MLSQRELRQEAQAIIKGCPLIARHVSTGLDRRLCDEQWYENPLICHALIFGYDKWLTTLEISLQEADFENITNYDKIFGDLRGADDSYDEQLFDIFAEVQLARWARKAGYDKVEKILPPSHGKCPDFLLTSGQNVTLAEAKHCREDDFVLDFLCSRLQGSALFLAA